MRISEHFLPLRIRNLANLVTRANIIVDDIHKGIELSSHKKC